MFLRRSHRLLGPFSRSSSSRHHLVHVALGSNLGDRVRAIHRALQRIRESDAVQLVCTSFLYESSPMYHVDQSPFLNAIVQLRTSMDPFGLLHLLKSIEVSVGRKPTFTNGPRVIDLDIVLYEDAVINSEVLTVPHPRAHERGFVLLPLCDIDPNIVIPGRDQSAGYLLRQIPLSERMSLRRVFPLGKDLNGFYRLEDFQKQTKVMGILNVTPDSFSDGGRYVSMEAAVAHAQVLLADCADIIDIGGESTRPHALPVGPEEEMRRILPVIRRLREKHLSVTISVDTRSSVVAEAALQAGADVINDVSAGRHDPAMVAVAAAAFAPMVFMHSRGTPETMTELTSYDDPIADSVSAELSLALKAADELLPRWLQFTDPGIGFAKTGEQNLALLHPDNLRRFKHALGNRPMLVGASRKRFLKSALGIGAAITTYDLDLGTYSTCCSAVMGGADMVRVHNVRGARCVCDVMRAIVDSDRRGVES